MSKKSTNTSDNENEAYGFIKGFAENENISVEQITVTVYWEFDEQCENKDMEWGGDTSGKIVYRCEDCISEITGRNGPDVRERVQSHELYRNHKMRRISDGD